MVMTAAAGVGNEEGVRRGIKTVELNQNPTPDQDQYRDPYRIPKDIPPITLPNTLQHFCLCRLCCCCHNHRHCRGDSPTQDHISIEGEGST